MTVLALMEESLESKSQETGHKEAEEEGDHLMEVVAEVVEDHPTMEEKDAMAAAEVVEETEATHLLGTFRVNAASQEVDTRSV